MQASKSNKIGHIKVHTRKCILVQIFLSILMLPTNSKFNMSSIWSILVGSNELLVARNVIIDTKMKVIACEAFEFLLLHFHIIGGNFEIQCGGQLQNILTM